MIKTLIVALSLLLASPALAYERIFLDTDYGISQQIHEIYVEVEDTPPRFSNPYVVTSHYGGRLTEYVDLYNEVRRQGVNVRIEDICLSACTFILGLVPRDRVCVTEHALIGFHSAHDGRGNFSQVGTRLVWNLYPDWVQRILLERGWNGDGPNSHSDFVYFRGTEFYELCDD